MAKGTGVKVTVKDLEHFLKSENVETIKTGIMLADEAGIGDEAMEMLCEVLGDDDVRQDAAYALGMIGDARAVEPLIKVMWDEVRATTEWWYGDYAMDALVEIGDARAVGPLIDVLETNSSDEEGGWKIGCSAAYALGEFDDTRCIDALISSAVEVSWANEIKHEGDTTNP